MAKLSANGSAVVARWEKEEQDGDARKLSKLALRSDGVLLSGLVVWRPHGIFADKTQRDDYGWRVTRRFKKDRVNEVVSKLNNILAQKGYRQVSA